VRKRRSWGEDVKGVGVFKDKEIKMIWYICDIFFPPRRRGGQIWVPPKLGGGAAETGKKSGIGRPRVPGNRSGHRVFIWCIWSTGFFFSFSGDSQRGPNVKLRVIVVVYDYIKRDPKGIHMRGDFFVVYYEETYTGFRGGLEHLTEIETIKR
jgi:hypothetical protein